MRGEKKFSRFFGVFFPRRYVLRSGGVRFEMRGDLVGSEVAKRWFCEVCEDIVLQNRGHV